MTIEDIVAQGDLVAYRATYTGTNEGEAMGVPATGIPMSIEGNVFVRIEDGKITELRGQLDTLGLMRQLGVTEVPSESCTGRDGCGATCYHTLIRLGQYSPTTENTIAMCVRAPLGTGPLERRNPGGRSFVLFA